MPLLNDAEINIAKFDDATPSAGGTHRDGRLVTEEDINVRTIKGRMDMLWFRKSTIAAAAALIFATSVGVAPALGAAETSASSINYLTYTGKNRTSILEAAAKGEGKLVLELSLAGPVINALVAGFQQEYPYIHVTTLRPASASALIEGIDGQERTGQVTTDVMEYDPTQLQILRGLGDLVPYKVPQLAKVPKKFILPYRQGEVLMATDRMSILGFGWNTKLFPASDVPNSLNDLLKPALHGKLTLTQSGAIYFIGSVLNQLGQQKGKAFLKKLAATNPTIEDISAGAMFAQIAQGQLAASPDSYHDHDLTYASEGDPVKWKPIGEDYVSAGSIAMIKGAPDPAAAVLFAQYAFGPAARKIYQQYFYSFPGEKLPFKMFIPDEVYNTPYKITTAYNEWQSLFNQDFA